MKSFQKSKSRELKGQNAAGPKFRTPSSFKSNSFAGKKSTPQLKFNPGQFKIQHKG
jgi:hypothetical protein